jgi:uncharacterized protein (TIGR02246 family)
MDDQAIRRLVDDFLSAWNRHDMRAFATLYRDDADFVNVYGMHWRSAAEIAEQHRALHETIFSASRLTASRVDLKFLRPDVATAHVFWDLSGLVRPDGEAAPDRRGVLTHVLVRDGSNWKIAATHNTDIVPRPQ